MQKTFFVGRGIGARNRTPSIGRTRGSRAAARHDPLLRRRMLSRDTPCTALRADGPPEISASISSGTPSFHCPDRWSGRAQAGAVRTWPPWVAARASRPPLVRGVVVVLAVRAAFETVPYILRRWMRHGR